jgi:ABC-type multidrug transport system fused ATPase/permease subunit
LGVFECIFDFISLSLFKEFIKSFDPSHTPMFDFKLMAAIFLISKVFTILLTHQSNMFQNVFGFKSSIQYNCFVYSKMLRASPASKTKKSREGEILSFLQTDSLQIAFTMSACSLIFTVPIQLCTNSYLLFSNLGISFLFGLATMFLLLIFNYYIQIKYRKEFSQVLRRRDERSKIIVETFNNLKVLKLYAWEDEFMRRIEECRNRELIQVERCLRFNLINLPITWTGPVLVSIISIGTYLYFTGYMEIANILTCITIFNNIQEPLGDLPWILGRMNETLLSLGRIEKFLDQDEVDDSNLIRNDVEAVREDIAIKVENGNFSWGIEFEEEIIKEDKVDLTKSIVLKDNDNANINSNSDNELLEKSGDATRISIMKENLRTILKDINLTIHKGEFVAIVGEVGAGKSSLLQAILNNMIIMNKEENNTKLILNGKVGYVAQIPWIQNDTVKNNILFNSPYDEKKYKKIVDICELRPDLEVLVGGDMTEIGEKGINLSGGQKARINIARALYAETDIVILDDPISALDAHVAQNVMKNCIFEYLSNKTRILVTHAFQYLEYADRIIYMNSGKVKWEGNFNEFKQEGFLEEFAVKMMKSNSMEIENRRQSEESVQFVKIDLNEKEKPKEVIRITKDEDQEVGKVKLSVYLNYINLMGGFIIFVILVICVSIWQGLLKCSDLWLLHWTDNQHEDDNWYYYGIYIALGLSSIIFIFLRVLILNIYNIKTAKNLHETIIRKLVRAPINLYHDTVPKGQIFNKLSKDIYHSDMLTAPDYGSVLIYCAAFVAAIIVCSLKFIYCLIFIPFILFSGILITRFSLNASRDLARLDGIIRSPIVNLINQTLPGTITIRAYQFEQFYMKKFCERSDDYFNIRMLRDGVGEWFGLVLDLLSLSLIIFIVVVTSILGDEYFPPQTVGLMLTYALTLQSSVFKLLKAVSNLENRMVTMERLLKFTEIQTERPHELPIDNQLSAWPSLGEIKFMNYSVRYRPGTDLVLKNLNFEISSREKIGVVGRTGSGKSTLCLSLFRILEADSGSIYIDDIDISTIGLKKLRSSLTIIPQDPNLMQGTIKYNIDPLGYYEDSDIKSVMEKIGFWYICENNDKGLEQHVNIKFNN